MTQRWRWLVLALWSFVVFASAGCSDNSGPSVPADFKPSAETKTDGAAAKGGRTPGASGIMEKPKD